MRDQRLCKNCIHWKLEKMYDFLYGYGRCGVLNEETDSEWTCNRFKRVKVFK